MRMLKSLDWVSSGDQLADCLTKKGSENKADWLLKREKGGSEVSLDPVQK